MNKIKDFFKKINELLKTMYKHQKFHILIGALVPLILWTLGFSFLGSLLWGALAGLIEEVIYCFSPLKTVKIWKWEIKVPDLKEMWKEIKSGNMNMRHKFENDNYKYNFIGLFIYILIIVLIKIF